MNTIKTVAEIFQERMNECVDILSKRFLCSVRPIYGSNEQNKPYHIGSCVLIAVGAKKYLVTAAHVIDHNDRSTLYVAGTTNLVKIEAECIISKSIDGSRKNDKFDFAVMSLSDQVVQELGTGTKFLKESDILLATPKQRSLYLALGYPNSRNKTNNLNLSVSQNPFVFSSTLVDNPDIFKGISVSAETHYLLDFCRKHSKDVNNKIVNSISPIGASGGGLFFIDAVSNPENLRPGSGCTGKLVGILVEHHKTHKIILATKLTLVMNAIKSI